MATKLTYYVTNHGLAAALANPSVQQTLLGILIGKAHPSTTRSFLTRGYIAAEKRDTIRADHNSLVLSGAVTRVREVLLASNPPPPHTSAERSTTRPKLPVSYTPKAEPPMATFPPTVQRVWNVLKHGALTFAQLRAHADLASMNPGTLRWTINVLRQAGLVESVGQPKVAA